MLPIHKDHSSLESLCRVADLKKQMSIIFFKKQKLALIVKG